MRDGIGICLLAALVLLVASAANAQPRPRRPTEPRVEVSVGGLMLGGYDLTAVDASLTRNQPGGGGFTLFRTDTRMASGAGLEARLGWRITRAITAEGGVLVGRRRLTARLSGDTESASDLTVEDQLTTYVIDGAVLANLRGLTFAGGRGLPFLRVGVGYLRELHEDNILVETGRAYHAGGGVTVWFGARRRLALRADGRVYMFDGGVNLDTGTRVAPAGGAAVVFAF